MLYEVITAVYYPEDDAYLLEKEPTVTHYAVDSWHGLVEAAGAGAV